MAGGDVAVDRLVGDVEPAARQTVEQRPRLRPTERPRRLFTILGADAILWSLADSV